MDEIGDALRERNVALESLRKANRRIAELERKEKVDESIFDKMNQSMSNLQVGLLETEARIAELEALLRDLRGLTCMVYNKQIPELSAHADQAIKRIDRALDGQIPR
jgi:hypothetical protein